MVGRGESAIFRFSAGTWWPCPCYGELRYANSGGRFRSSVVPSVLRIMAERKKATSYCTARHGWFDSHDPSQQFEHAVARISSWRGGILPLADTRVDGYRPLEHSGAPGLSSYGNEGAGLAPHHTHRYFRIFLPSLRVTGCVYPSFLGLVADRY